MLLLKFFILGITIEVKTTPIRVRTIILSAVADAPARCAMLDFVQFNGRYGCPCCYEPGETLFMSESSRSHIYPYNLDEEYCDSGHTKIRTHEETKQYAHTVEKKYLESRRREPVPEMGVKGLSALSFMPKFDIIRGTGIDYMHCVLLGIVKMMIGLWIDLDHKNKAWSVRSSIDKLNERIQQLSSPSLISRLPRKIDEYHDWKASEYRTFLLFFSLPLLSDILPSNYYTHYSNIVFGTFLLLKSSISATDLSLSKHCFKKFCLGGTFV